MAAVVAVVAGLVVVALIGFDLRRQSRLQNRAREVLRHAGDDGVPPATVEQALDRLERRLTATPVDRSESTRLRQALDGMSAGAVVFDERGTEFFRNRSAEPFATARHGDALVQLAIQAAAESTAGGGESVEELHLTGPPERSLIVAGSPLVAAGTLVGAIVLIEDISETVRIDAIRRDFVANVSHELRTPVGALSLLAETLEGENDPEIVGRFVHRIQEETDRLSALIDDLLDLSRIEGGLGPDLESVPVGDIAHAAVAAVRAHAAHRRVILSVEESGAESVAVYGDRAQLISAVTTTQSSTPTPRPRWSYASPPTVGTWRYRSPTAAWASPAATNPGSSSASIGPTPVEPVTTGEPVWGSP